MKQTLLDICDRELKRLDAKSVSDELSYDDVKKLEGLTRALKQLEEPPQKDDGLEAVTEEELLLILQSRGPHGNYVKPEQVPGGTPSSSGPKKGRK